MTVQAIQEDYKGNYYLVNPNLGHPLIININPNLKNNRIETKLLFVSNIVNQEEFRKDIQDRIKLVPILEFKWKLKLIIETLKKELKETKKKGIIRRWKEKRLLKKKLKKSSTISFKSNRVGLIDLIKKELFRDEKQESSNPRAYRGDPITPIVLNIEYSSIKSITDPNYDEYFSPRNYLIKQNVFRSLDIYYTITIEFQLTEEIIEFLRYRNFIMFDILYKNSKSDLRINYHALVVSKQKWDNIKFIHATDLHIAERNDKIYGIVKKWTKLFTGEYLDAISKEQDKFDDNEEEDDLSSETIKEMHKPLKKRFINPNNQFRRFIKIINKKVLQNDIDFVALTGDLIDFSLLSKFPKDLNLFYSYNHSNWRIFKEIVLNLTQKKRKGNARGEELLCPIFTITGNHDYRPFHYDMRWAGLYRKMGLKASEALALNDSLVAFPISAIIKSKKSILGYLSEINPSLDYYLKLGNINFIFLNAGSDSYKNITDLITGHPSLTGITNKQVKYLENLVNNKIKPKENTFLLLHGPVINPKKKIGIIKRISNTFGKKILTKLEEFRESLLSNIGKKMSKMRIDENFNIKYGTISSNWEKIIKFCKDYCILTLTGHTHALKEFRLGDPQEIKMKKFNTAPFNIKKLENPVAVFFDNYSDLFTNAKDIEKFGPFIVQTPALGLGGYTNPRLAGAYREIEIKDGKLSSFKVKYIHR